MGPATVAPPSASPFDAATHDYDATFTDTDLGRRLREAAWAWLDRAFGSGDRVLELGCGTGADAVRLAGRGVAVVASDASSAMLARTRERARAHDVDDLVTVARIDLARVGEPGWEAGLEAGLEPPFDGAFSDFGAIDVLADRAGLLRGLAPVIRPGGRLVLVGMGPLCLWEVAWHLAHGEPRAATRRWRAGARAALPGGAALAVWYPSARRVVREARPWFDLVRAGGLGVALPPSGLSVAMERRGWLLRALAPAERRLGATPVGAALADHWVVELRRRHG